MRKLFRERKLLKGGNYMRKYGKFMPISGKSQKQKYPNRNFFQDGITLRRKIKFVVVASL